MKDILERQSYIASLALVFIAYAATAKIGLSIYPVHEFATLIWPPTGIALAVLVLRGYKLAPAIFLAALLVNFTTGATLVVSLGIATGNTLEAIVGAFLLRIFVGIDFSFGHLRESIAFIICGAIVAPIVSATIGVTSLELGGMIANSDFAPMWITWWAGDALGALVVAPFLIRWLSRPYYERTAAHYLEMTAVIMVISASTFVIFWTPFFPFVYPIFVPLVWAALRCGPRGVTLSILLMSIISLTGTLSGHGPYSSFPIHLELLFLHTFIATAAAIFLIFASIVEDRRRSTQQLRVQVDQLEKAMGKIRTEDDAKTEFLAILAHELRNPLAPMLSSLELMKAYVKEREPSRLVATIEKHTRSISRLLDDLLEVSRISAKQFKLRPRLFDVRESIEHAIQTVEPARRARGHTLDRTTPADALYIEADPLRLEQIIVNLLNNAAKYTPPGGRIALTCLRERDDLVISVRDSGIGIEKNMLDKIFEPFVQINKTSSVRGGVGIGLSLTKRLVEMHGGSIAVSSEGEGHGSEFRVRIPLRMPERTKNVEAVVAPKKKAAHIGRAPKSLEILVVDDNIDAATALGKLLEARGHTVALAHDGTSTLKIAKATKPRVVILDIGLPDMTGYQVARELKKLNIASALIALTGYGQESDKAKARDAGFAYHLTKPVGLAQLEEALAHVTQTPAKS